jgi:hypothetical protein
VDYCAEQFKNDGSPTSTIVKSVKRAMAGEYSRMNAVTCQHLVLKWCLTKFEQQVQVHKLFDTPPALQFAARPKISDAYRWIMENEFRSQRIDNDVVECVRKSKHPIVLTERREHAETINSILLKQGIDSIVLNGAMRAA